MMVSDPYNNGNGKRLSLRSHYVSIIKMLIYIFGKDQNMIVSLVFDYAYHKPQGDHAEQRAACEESLYRRFVAIRKENDVG